jgi:hypothetical protein
MRPNLKRGPVAMSESDLSSSADAALFEANELTDIPRCQFSGLKPVESIRQRKAGMGLVANQMTWWAPLRFDVARKPTSRPGRPV